MESGSRRGPDKTRENGTHRVDAIQNTEHTIGAIRKAEPTTRYKMEHGTTAPIKYGVPKSSPVQDEARSSRYGMRDRHVQGRETCRGKRAAGDEARGRTRGKYF